MPIRHDDPLDVLRHYIVVGLPENANLEPLTVALEALSDRLDALDNITRWLAAGAKPPYDFVDAIQKEREACAEIASECGDDSIVDAILSRS